MKREEQRERLLEAAYSLVAEVGVSGLRTRDIAEKAGVNVATLHYCFETKDALLQSLYDFIIGRVRAESTEYLAGKDAAQDWLRAQAEFRLRYLRERPASVLAWRAFTEGVWTSPAVRDIMRRHFAEQRQRLADVLRRGRADGAVTGLPTDDDDLAASLLMSLYDGLTLQWALDPEAFSIDAYSDAILRWLGVGAPANEEARVK